MGGSAHLSYTMGTLLGVGGAFAFVSELRPIPRAIATADQPLQCFNYSTVICLFLSLYLVSVR